MHVEEILDLFDRVTGFLHRLAANGIGSIVVIEKPRRHLDHEALITVHESGGAELANHHHAVAFHVIKKNGGGAAMVMHFPHDAHRPAIRHALVENELLHMHEALPHRFFFHEPDSAGIDVGRNVFRLRLCHRICPCLSWGCFRLSVWRRNIKPRRPRRRGGAILCCRETRRHHKAQRHRHRSEH